MGQPAMNGFAFTVVLAVLVTIAASLTLLPAMLGFTGHGIERLHVPFVSKQVRPYDTSRWFRWSRFIQRRPWIAAIGGLAVLLALAAPFLGIRFGFPDAENDPQTSTTRPGLRPPRRRVRPRLLSPDGAHRPRRNRRPPGRCRRRWGPRWARSTAWPTSPRPIVNDVGDTAVLTLIPTTSPQDAATEDLVDRLRDDGDPDGHRGHRPDGPRRWHGRREPRHHPGDRRPAAALLRRRAADVVPAADDGVPLGRGAARRPCS